MHSMEKPKIIDLIISSFYRLGLWHRGDLDTVNETGIRIFYSIYHLLFPISILSGVVTSGSTDESIFLVEEAIVVTVLSVKLFHIIWRKKEICDLLEVLSVYLIEDHKVFTVVRDKSKDFTKFVTIFVLLSSVTAMCAVLVVPFVGSEKKLFLNIAFPLENWKCDNISFWVAFTFFSTEVLLTYMGFLFSVLIWYFMFNCAIRYEMIGYQIRSMGVVNETDKKRKISDVEKEKIFRLDFVTTVESHERINEYTNFFYE